MVGRKFLTITEESHRTFIAESTELISQGDPLWFESLLGNIERDSKRPRAEIDSFIDRFHQIPDSLRYVQLGSPEQIVIVSDNMVEAGDVYRVGRER